MVLSTNVFHSASIWTNVEESGNVSGGIMVVDSDAKQEERLHDDEYHLRHMFIDSKNGPHEGLKMVTVATSLNFFFFKYKVLLLIKTVHFVNTISPI